MKILVLIKEVPDMEKVTFDSEKGIVNRAGAPAEINPFDESALQAAVDLKNKYKDIEITVMTMGPPRAEKTLRSAYAKGADKMVLLTDPKFGGSDTFATARALSAAIKTKGIYDLIICGEKSVDGDTAQVGPEVAEFLGIPHSCYISEIISGDNCAINVSVENIGGSGQIRRMNLPALCCVTKNIASPKLPTVNRKLESLTAPVEILTLADLGEFLCADQTGFTGSPTKVHKIVIPGETVKESIICRDDVPGFADTLCRLFVEKGILR